LTLPLPSSAPTTSSAPATPSAPPRRVRTEAERRGELPLERRGARRAPWRDLYHTLLVTTWRRFFVLVVTLYVEINALFALGYLALSDGVEHLRPGSFSDAFFFSVQTMATIGYGTMAPRSVPAHALVTIEALTGMLGVAMATGLMFAKFARPTARVLFSRVAVISPRDGTPSFILRVANERSSRILEATVRVVLLRDEVTREGESIRRPIDLALLRSQTVIFALSWTIVHPITEQSPLYGVTNAQLRAWNAQIIVSIVGLDETFGQTIHARYTYDADEVVCDARFVDVIVRQPNGPPMIDYAHFHDVVPLDPSPQR
jgi:inward rectifier potassium channel